MGSRLEIWILQTATAKSFMNPRGVLKRRTGCRTAKNYYSMITDLLYTDSGKGGVPEKLNTGSAAKLNNDHGISFDGKTAGHQ